MLSKIFLFTTKIPSLNLIINVTYINYQSEQIFDIYGCKAYICLCLHQSGELSMKTITQKNEIICLISYVIINYHFCVLLNLRIPPHGYCIPIDLK